jgi:hypothetical protein
MSRFPRPPCAPAVLLLGFVLALSGCGTRENRTITFSTDGRRVAFQHGREGVFVADKDGRGLTKIFTPGKDVIAVGTPLWAPNDRRLIFTTARAPDGVAAVVPASADDPAGRVFVRQPAVYTCWLRDEPQGDNSPEPRPLFSAALDDVGHVTGGLAVRWHPKGGRILYVKQVGGGQAVFEFDLKSRESRRVFPDADTATAVVFDWSPDGSHLACVLAGTPGAREDGIWVGRDGSDWWHVGESVPLSIVPGGLLEWLKASRPVWTNDGRRFAFVTALPGSADGDPGRHCLWVATLEGRDVRQLLGEKQPLRDLAWQPNGERLGFLTGGEAGTLRVCGLKGDPVTVTPRAVRSFAGWDSKGKSLAYTTADAIPLRDEGGFGLLLFPDLLARDALWVAPGDGKGAGRIVVSGLRTTFVRWSPTEETLSQWFTFSPTHHSVLSQGLGSGLRRGDPAATIDPATGTISWMAVDAHEEAQVGHYHLLKRQYAEAWKWYEQAEREPAKAEPAARGERRPFRDPVFFVWYCLEKLGRHDEAAKRLTDFRKKAADLLPPDDPNSPVPAQRTVRRLAALARDLYASEVFLSLDAAEDGEAYFRRAQADAQTDDDRLSAAVVLSQLLLLRGHTADYADVATDTVAPLLLQAWQPQPAGGDVAKQRPAQPLVVNIAALGLLPLTRSDLLATLPEERALGLAARWAALRDRAPDDLSRLGADVILEGLYRRLGRERQAAEVRQRLRTNPSAGGGLSTDVEFRKGYKQLREALDEAGPLAVWMLGPG